MSSEKPPAKIREAAVRVEQQASELLTLLRERGFAANTEIAQTVAEILSYLRKEDDRREVAYLLLEHRAERLITGFQEFIASTEARKVLGRELVEERANVMSLRRENFRLQTEHSKLEEENSNLHVENSQLRAENCQLKARWQQFEESLGVLRQAINTATNSTRIVTNSRIVKLSQLVGSNLCLAAKKAALASALAQESVEQLEKKTNGRP
jgi:hypothetical protein